MPNARPLLSAAGVLTGALLFAASPASAQWPVFDGINYALQGVIKTIEETMSNTLSNITKQLELTGPLGTILGSVENGSVTTLLQQGFTQNANYAKASVDAYSQIADGALTSNARFQRDMRNAHIRDEHTTSSLHCVALDAGQSVTGASGSSWKVAQSISDVADNRGEAGSEPASLLRPGAGGRRDRATPLRPLLLAGRGHGRPVLVVPDPERRPAGHDSLRERDARWAGRRHGGERLRDEPHRADCSGGAPRRPADLRDRSRRRRPPSRLQCAHLARPAYSRLRRSASSRPR